MSDVKTHQATNETNLADMLDADTRVDLMIILMGVTLRKEKEKERDY